MDVFILCTMISDELSWFVVNLGSSITFKRCLLCFLHSWRNWKPFKQYLFVYILAEPKNCQKNLWSLWCKCSARTRSHVWPHNVPHASVGHSLKERHVLRIVEDVAQSDVGWVGWIAHGHVYQWVLAACRCIWRVRDVKDNYINIAAAHLDCTRLQAIQRCALPYTVPSQWRKEIWW